MGFLHDDVQNRDSLALDQIETLRPEVARFVLDLLCTFGPMRYLSRRLVAEKPDGGCRLVAPLTHQFAEQTGRWSRIVSPHAKRVAQIVTNVANGEVRPTIPASQAKRGDDQAGMAGIVCVELLGCVWSKVPATLGVSRYTCSARLAVWQRAEVWSGVRNMLNTSAHVTTLCGDTGRAAA